MKNIRIGILLESHQAPNWLYVSLEKIWGLDRVSIAAIILLPPDQNHKNQPNGLTKALYNIFLFLEQSFLKLIPNALEKKDLRDLCDGIPTFNIIKNETKHIEQLNLDVVINLVSQPGEDTLHKLAAICLSIISPSGMLSCNDQFLGFMETYKGKHTSQIALLIITQDGTEILNNTHTSTNLLSYSRNRNRLLWTATQFYPRAIEKIRDIGINTFLKNASTKNISRTSKEHPKTKTTKILLAPFKTIPRYLQKKIQRFLYRDQWALFYSQNSDHQNGFLMGKPIAISPSLDRFWADPHIIKINRDHYIFFEELLYRNGKGTIAYIKIDENGILSPARKILEKSYHLSYPFIFHYQNEYHMIPESAANGTVDLYRCLEFPQKWEFRKTLLQNLYALDTTVLEWGEKWWLFTTIRGHKGASSYDELFLFFADDLLSEEWTPHPKNPIVSDVRSARPAGKIFIRQGKLYRPSQDCSIRYGYGVRINQIETLSITEYQESTVEFIQPLWDKRLVATHTFSTSSELTFMDAAIRRRKF